MQKCLRDAIVDQKFAKFASKRGKLRCDLLAILGREHLGAALADLRSVETDPDAVHFGPRIPEGDVLFQIAGTLEHGAGDYPMNVDFAARDILEDDAVGRGLSPHVVMFGQAVDGNRNAKAGQVHPAERDWDYTAGDNERENIHGAEGGKDQAEFAMAHERFATDQGDVHGLVSADEVQDTVDQGGAAKVTQFSQDLVATEVSVAVSVTAGAA